VLLNQNTESLVLMLALGRLPPVEMVSFTIFGYVESAIGPAFHEKLFAVWMLATVSDDMGAYISGALHGSRVPIWNWDLQ
jgi:hypothetical protein